MLHMAKLPVPGLALLHIGAGPSCSQLPQALPAHCSS